MSIFFNGHSPLMLKYLNVETLFSLFFIVEFHHSKGERNIQLETETMRILHLLSYVTVITDPETFLVWKLESRFSGVLHPHRVLCTFSIFKSQFKMGQGPGI